MRYDVAVVGAGVTGLSIAWHLTERRDRSVVLFDGQGVGSGASSIQPGGVRQQWGTRMSCRLAIESFRFYEGFDRRVEARVSPGLTKCGYLFVAESKASSEQLASNVELQNSEGIMSRLVDGEEAAELVPGLNPEGIAAASWHDQDGYFDRPLAIIGALHEAAVERGAQVVGRNVRRLERHGSAWQLTLSDGETVTAETVIVAAAHETRALLADLGVEVPVTKEPKYLFYSNPISQRLLDPLAVFMDRHFASKQLADGSVLASDLTAEGDPATMRDTWYRHVKESIRERLPVLDLVSFPVLVEGFYDVTPDKQPIVGPAPGQEGLWLATGLNGRGLMMAPAFGRLVAEALTTGSLPEPLPELSLERFAVDALIPEPQIV